MRKKGRKTIAAPGKQRYASLYIVQRIRKETPGDGGVASETAMKKLLAEAALLPVFRQFVGIGGKNYGMLEEPDAPPGRVVDNCDFFSPDDIDAVSDQELCDRLPAEFPDWPAAAREKRIARAG